MTNALRLAVGTLTVVRVRPPSRITPRTAGRAMLLAPLVGLALGLVAETVGLMTRWLVIGYSDRLLVAVAVVATLALLTRGLHLDGLADTADGLGSGKDAAGALEVMRQSDIGPFGVITLVLVLSGQVAALYTALLLGRGTLALVGAAVVSRLAITWACRRGVAAAHPGGLGATVAGSVPIAAVIGTTVVVAALLVGVVWLDDDIGYRFVLNVLFALAGSIAVSQVFVLHCVRRLGGVTGDVLGAACEVAFLTFAVLICLR